jgi:Uma2 family endonuclease
MAPQPQYPLLAASEFLEFEFSDRRVELDNGVIRILAGATVRHSMVQANMLSSLSQSLHGTGYSPFLSSMALQTHDCSVRHPDIAVYPTRGGREFDDLRVFDDPLVIVEIQSDGTARTDLNIKVPEYKALASVDTIILVDIATERLHVWQRTPTNGWNEQPYAEPVDLDLPSLGITLPNTEIFARD